MESFYSDFKLKVILGLFFLLFYLFVFVSLGNQIPYGNGAWVYDTVYNSDSTKGAIKPGLFVEDINIYNTKFASFEANQINQIFVYGGDLENGKNRKMLNFSDYSAVYYYPPQNIGKDKEWKDWENILLKKGACGFRSVQAYVPKNQFLYGKGNAPLVLDNTGIDGVNYKIIVIDGRVDKGGYLQGLNLMTEPEARGLARKVAGTICADNSIDGIQFDIEPFSFNGGKGGENGDGQKFFYQEMAKCLAGWHSNSYENSKEINRYGEEYDSNADPIGAVNKKHPYGRFFSVFTFSDSVSDEVVDVYKKFGNFYIIDSLYDLENSPGAKTPTTPEKFKKLVRNEIDKIRTKGIPYQFAIPAAASCHEFESSNGIKNHNIDTQLDYVRIVMQEIKPGKLKKEDPYFKGIALWSWNSAMWWNGNKLEPAKPAENVLKYLGKNIGTLK